MKVLRNGEARRTFICGQAKPEDKIYWLQTYVIRENDLIYLPMTGMLVRLSPEELRMIEKLPEPYAPSMRALIETGILVPEDRDDAAELRRYRSILRKVEERDAITHYTILPTTACNARCFYCYEEGIPVRTMTAEIAMRTADYIADHCQSYPVSLNWFGGEPLLGVSQIDQICESLQERNVHFTSSLVTNGLLMNREMADHASQKWNLKHVQITLDGTEKNYASVKQYRSAPENPFATVIQQIHYLLEKRIHVAIRMNLDLHNAEDLRILIRYLGEEYPEKKDLSAEIICLYEGEGPHPISHTSQERESLAQTRTELGQLLREVGIREDGKERQLPVLQHSFCMADRTDTVLINPEGGIGKCEHQIFKQLCGTIFSENLEEGIAKQWSEVVEYTGCTGCELAPGCIHLAHCKREEPCTPQKKERLLAGYREEIRRIAEDCDDTKE